MPNDRTVLDILAKTVGPAPWYWETFPPLERYGQRLEWRRNETSPGGQSSVLLHPEGDENHIVLSLSTYTRVFPLSPSLLGLWFEDGRCIRVFALDPETLTDYSLDSEPESIKDYGGFRSGAEILGEFYFSLDLEAGEHRIDLPVAFSGLDRLLMVGSYAMIQEGACAAAFEIRPGTAPGSRRIAVYPQKWFTRDKIDLGYQWITRMAREPDSGRLVGDGIRLPRAFVMEKDGCHVERWIGPEQ